MPYKIKQFDKGFKVVSDKGHILSNKPLTKKQAQKQLIAISINEQLFGSGLAPPEKDFFQASKESYNITNDPAENIDNLKLILDTPTVKAYLNDEEKTILVAIRGTKSTSDFLTDTLIPFNLLDKSQRYQDDKNIILNLLSQYPSPPYDYYITGHSLGGAETSLLMRDLPIFKSGVVYNPASQPFDYIYQQNDKLKRIYADHDPLYSLGTQNIIKSEVVPTTQPLKSTLGGLNLYALAQNFLQGHKLSNFAQLYGKGYPHLNNDNYSLHAVIFKKPINIETVIEKSEQFTQKKGIPFIRETNTSFRVRNIPKTKFISNTFRTKRINQDISLVFGELK
jgi:hypothetical protein